MSDFHSTLMGRKFYESDVPRIASALERLAKTFDKIVDAETPVTSKEAEHYPGGEAFNELRSVRRSRANAAFKAGVDFAEGFGGRQIPADRLDEAADEYARTQP